METLVVIVTLLPGIFSVPLPWPAELAVILICVLIGAAPTLVKSVRSVPSAPEKEANSQQQADEQHR